MNSLSKYGQKLLKAVGNGKKEFYWHLPYLTKLYTLRKFKGIYLQKPSNEREQIFIQLFNFLYNQGSTTNNAGPGCKIIKNLMAARSKKGVLSIDAFQPMLLQFTMRLYILKRILFMPNSE